MTQGNADKSFPKPSSSLRPHATSIVFCFCFSHAPFLPACLSTSRMFPEERGRARTSLQALTPTPPPAPPAPSTVRQEFGARSGARRASSPSTRWSNHGRPRTGGGAFPGSSHTGHPEPGDWNPEAARGLPPALPSGQSLFFTSFFQDSHDSTPKGRQQCLGKLHEGRTGEGAEW